MRRKGLESGARNERGAVIVFVLVVMVFLLMIGGLAVDYAHMFVADKELEKSVSAEAKKSEQ